MERQQTRDRDRPHTGNLGELRQCFVMERHNTGEVALESRRLRDDVHRHDVVGVEAELDASQASVCLHEQPAAHEQHKCQSHFGHDKRHAHPIGGGRRGALLTERSPEYLGELRLAASVLYAARRTPS